MRGVAATPLAISLFFHLGHAQTEPSLSPTTSKIVRDFYGDSIPNGATARFGTSRLRLDDCTAFYLSADGTLLAAADAQRRIRVWQTKDGAPVLELTLPGNPIVAFGFSANKSELFVLAATGSDEMANSQSTLSVFEIGSGRLRNQVVLKDVYSLHGASHLDIGEDGKHFRVVFSAYESLMFENDGTKIGSPRIEKESEYEWPKQYGTYVLTGVRVQQLSFHPREGPVSTTPWHFRETPAFAESPSGKTVVAIMTRLSGDAPHVVVFDGVTGRQLVSFQATGLSSTGQEFPIEFLDEDHLLVANTSNGKHGFAVLHLKDGRLKTANNFPSWEYAAYRISPDRRVFARLANSHTFQLWDLTRGVEVTPLADSHGGTILGIEFSNDGKRLLTHADDRSIRMWDAETHRQLWMHSSAGSMRARVSTDWRSVLAFDSGELTVLDAASGKAGMAYFALTEALITDARCGPDSRSVWIACRDGTVKELDATDGKTVKSFKIESRTEEPSSNRPGRWLSDHDNPGTSPLVQYPALVPNWKGLSIVAPLADRSALGVFDGAIGKEVRRIGSEAPWWLAISAIRGGTQFVPVAYTVESENFEEETTPEPRPRKYDIKIYDFETGATRHSVSVGSTASRTVALSADGKFIAHSDAEYPLVRIVRSDNGRIVKRILRLPAIAMALEFSPDGKRLVAGLEDSQILMWDIADATGAK
jgi:WD40 repeat protein